MLTNGDFDFITQGDEAGCREDRGQSWPLPGSAKRLWQRKQTRGASEQSSACGQYSENSLTGRCSVYKEDGIERIKPFGRRVCTAISVNDGKSRSVKQEFTLANVQVSKNGIFSLITMKPFSVNHYFA